MRIEGSRVLVTGGAGFIGRSLIALLLARGAWVRSLDNDFRGSSAQLRRTSERVELVEGDVRDPTIVADAVRGVDAVVHLAAVNGTEFFYSHPELVLEVAVKGMVNVLDACLRHGVRNLALASSSEVYQTPPSVPTDERAPLTVPDPLNPRYSYAGGKIVSELLAVNYGRKRFDRVVIVRPHNVYGPDMGSDHVVPQFILRMRELAAQSRGKVRFPIQGSGGETRAFVHIQDAVEGIALVLERGDHLGIYNVGSDIEVTIAQLAGEIARIFGCDIEVIPGALRAGSPRRRCPDISRIRGLGYGPRVSLREGLESTTRWYVENWPKARS